MQLDVNLVAAQFAIWWAQKFALRLMWLADQLVVVGVSEKIWDITEEILQSCVRLGFWRDSVTTRESHSKMKCRSSKDKAKWQARRAAVASPKTREHGGLIIVKQLIMVPWDNVMSVVPLFFFFFFQTFVLCSSY